VALSAVYTVTIPRDPADPAAAARFVNFLLSAPGKAVMQEHGLDVVAPVLTGDRAKLPADIHLP
jgi:molybdate/tungstate transport system substrate-binding protein